MNRERLQDLRRRQVQAMGGAITLRDWKQTELFFGQLRDVIDRYLNVPPCNPTDQQDLEDTLAELIEDSMGPDWTSRIGARAILRNLADEGLEDAAEHGQGGPDNALGKPVSSWRQGPSWPSLQWPGRAGPRRGPFGPAVPALAVHAGAVSRPGPCSSGSRPGLLVQTRRTLPRRRPAGLGEPLTA